MYIIVIGCGKVGYQLSRALLASGHEVLAVERNSHRCEMVNDELGNICMGGDGSEPHVLEEVGASRGDVLIAVTGLDEDNLAACQLAKHRFNVPRTIALINNPQNDPLFKLLGVDVTVSSTDIILNHIEEELPTHPLIHHVMSLRESQRELVDIRIPPDSASVGKLLSELELPQESIISLVVSSDGEPHLPNGELQLQANDEVVAVTTPEEEEALLEALTKTA